MSRRKLTVDRYKEIERLLAAGRGVREITRSLRCSRRLVRQIRDGVHAPPDLPRSGPEPLWMAQVDRPQIIHDLELGHPLKFLWEEKAQALTTYSNFWKQFYRRFPQYRQAAVTAREFQPGERVEVDYAGDTIEWVELSTGEIRKAYVFVAGLGFSQLLFAWAAEDTKSLNWLACHRRMFAFYGGVAHVTVPDFVAGNKIEHDVLHAPAERPERLLVQACPDLLVALPHDFAERLAGVLQRQHEQQRPAVLAGAIQRRGTEPEIDLGFLAGLALEHVEALGVPPPQRAHEALDRVVAVRKGEPLDQILVDRLGVAPELNLLADPAAVHLTGRVGQRSRWPGWWGILSAANRTLAALRAGGHPGGFCPGQLPANAPDRLAIHPGHPLDLALARPAAVQRLHRNPQVRLQDVHSPPPRAKGDSVTSAAVEPRAPTGAPLTSGVEDFQVATDGGFWPASRASTPDTPSSPPITPRR